MFKKLKKSTRGLTFSLGNKEKIGTKFRYVLDLMKNEVIIIEDKNGTGTVSRKRSGNDYKPLYDIRTKEVKEAVSNADYLEVEEDGENIVVRLLKKVKNSSKRSNLVKIEDILAVRCGEIVLNKASGFEFGKPTLFNDEYFDYICKNISSKHKTWKKEEPKLKKVFDVISLFSGSGLLDKGFQDPQFRFVYAVDFDKDACETYKENIGNHIHCKDIRDVSANEVPHADVVIGGPCCQGYSAANRSNIELDEAEAKRLLIDDYIRIVKAKEPKVFVIENVPQLLTAKDGLYIDKVFNELGKKYEITCKVIRDDQIGGYSVRKRAIVIGSRVGKIELPDATITTVKTVRDALSKVDSTWFNYEDITVPKEKTKEIMSYVRQGHNWKDVPENIHRFGPSTQSAVYHRLSWDEPSITITNWRKSNIIHPEENRILSVSEAAAIMGLDNSFRFLGSLASKQQQVANGVTQAMARFVKKYVLDALNSNILAFS